MNNISDRLKEINNENKIWIIYIGIIILSWYANSKEKKYIIFNDQVSKKEYQKTMIIIFSILLLVYYYFLKDSIDGINNLTIYDSDKKRTLTYASFIGSLLIFISGIIFLSIAINDNDIETEIAFN